jgi:hypothetical protein
VILCSEEDLTKAAYVSRKNGGIICIWYKVRSKLENITYILLIARKMRNNNLEMCTLIILNLLL